MTTEDIGRRLIPILELARGGDCETAHGQADDLLQDVLRAIAEGKARPSMRLLASTALDAYETVVTDAKWWGCA